MGLYEDMMKEAGGVNAGEGVYSKPGQLNILDDKGNSMSLQEGHHEIVKSGVIDKITPVQTAPAPEPVQAQEPAKRGKKAKRAEVPTEAPITQSGPFLASVSEKPKQLISIIDRETFEGGEFFCDEIVVEDGIVSILIDPSIKWSRPRPESKVIVRIDGKPLKCWSPGVAPTFPELGKCVAIFFLEGNSDADNGNST
jgi:hypothetical protein